MEILRQTPVAAVAAESPATTRVFERHGIDFCCGGGRPLGDVCLERGLDFDGLRNELLAAEEGPGVETRSWLGAPVAELISHILIRYHKKLREDLPRLGTMSDRVLAAHGERHPESVPEMVSLFREIRAELEPHMLVEEDEVFPRLLRLEALASAGRALPTPSVPNDEGIGALRAEHEKVGAALARLREVTSGFEPPADACNTFRGLLHGLAELETDLHQHIHLENNVLFPAAEVLDSGS